MEARQLLGACAWCGKDAYQRLVLRPERKLANGGYRVERVALVCPEHWRALAPIEVFDPR